MEKNFKNGHEVSDYASFLNKSPKTIANLFREHGEKTPLTSIHERILLQARRVLLFSKKHLKKLLMNLEFETLGIFQSSSNLANDKRSFKAWSTYPVDFRG